MALAEQKHEFIKLYPVPFENQLYINFELEQAETIQVKLTGINNGQTKIVEHGKQLQAGNQTYTVNASDLPNGMYVVKVITDSKVHTRIVVKQ
ncbi:T9SS type A sorting domain-containing protein [Wenyingzhuangia sp. IMCC45533]